jgi:hypothetical protein
MSRREKRRISVGSDVTRVKYLEASFQFNLVEVVGRKDRARLSKEIIAEFK